MGRFGSLGGGIADGVLAGQQINMQKEQFAAARQKSLADSLKASRDASESMFKELTSAAAQARAAGKSPEDLANLRKTAMLAISGFASNIEQARASAAANGMDPSSASPVSGEQYIAQRMQVFDAMIGASVSPEEQVAADVRANDAKVEALQAQFPNASREALLRHVNELEQAASPTFLARAGTPMAAELAKHGIQLAPGQSARVVQNRDPISGAVSYEAVDVKNDPKGTTVTVGGTTIGKPLLKVYANQLEGAFDAGRSASTNIARIEQLQGLLSDTEFKTGTVQEMLLPVQGLFESLGVDTKATAEKMGLKLNDVADAQTFERITREMIIESFQHFKGNLNQQEVKLAFDAFQQLGKDKDANMRALAALKAAARLALADYDEATTVTTDEAAGAWLRARNQRAEGTYQTLYDEAMAEMGGGEEFPLEGNEPPQEMPPGVPPGATYGQFNGQGWPVLGPAGQELGFVRKKK